MAAVPGVAIYFLRTGVTRSLFFVMLLAEAFVDP